MKMKRQYLPIMFSGILLLSACTTPIVRDTASISKQDCETVDCVIDLMDTLKQGNQEDRYPFM